VRPARAIAFLITLLGGLTILAVSISGLGQLWKALFLLALLIPAAFTVYRLLRPRLIRIGLEAGRLVTWDSSGGYCCWEIRGRPFLSPIYLGLPLADEDGRRSRLGLFRGQVDSQLWRQALIRFRGQSPG
jgi:hypothetical protein